MNGACVNPTQRQQTLPGFQPRDILPTNNASASASNVNLYTADRQVQPRAGCAWEYRAVQTTEIPDRNQS